MHDEIHDSTILLRYVWGEGGGASVWTNYFIAQCGKLGISDARIQK